MMQPASELKTSLTDFPQILPPKSMVLPSVLPETIEDSDAFDGAIL
jgi:hypothetical protein